MKVTLGDQSSMGGTGKGGKWGEKNELTVIQLKYFSRQNLPSLHPLLSTTDAAAWVSTEQDRWMAGLQSGVTSVFTRVLPSPLVRVSVDASLRVHRPRESLLLCHVLFLSSMQLVSFHPRPLPLLFMSFYPYNLVIFVILVCYCFHLILSAFI